MTPREIITQEVMKAPNIRIPFAKIIVERIFTALSDYGYNIVEVGGTGNETQPHNGRCGTCESSQRSDGA